MNPRQAPSSAIHLQDPFRRARRTPGKNSLPGSRCPSEHGRSGHRARTPGHGVHRHTRRCRRTCGRIQEGSPGMRVRHDGTAYSRPSTSPGGHSFHPLVSWTSRNPVPCEENLPGVEDFAQICRQARIDGSIRIRPSTHARDRNLYQNLHVPRRIGPVAAFVRCVHGEGFLVFPSFPIPEKGIARIPLRSSHPCPCPECCSPASSSVLLSLFPLTASGF